MELFCGLSDCKAWDQTWLLDDLSHIATLIRSADSAILVDHYEIFPHPPPHSTMPAAWHFKRACIACVHCRKRNIKCITPQEGQPCEWCLKRGLVCDYLSVPEEQAISASATAPDQDPPPAPTPPPHVAHWQIGSPPHFVHGHYPPKNDSQLNSIPRRPALTTWIRLAQLIVPGYPSSYERYFATFGLNDAPDISHDALACLVGHSPVAKPEAGATRDHAGTGTLRFE
ncbi:hypothetical protein FB451DRAFT_1188183 [Mycena latifolia]|nr:hypothetical protein FB451DRAFT_1188183 [Mycena latifolia]